ncbi:hypothetical protein Pmani_015807 [Petrolisthes manimaculis]|uniref:Uncharacterized protein n=1 Tax=Petrolisthes manimaculis TaxID=1843537 RepID=A0AAE1PQB1_9EUCA|nr:hypothetical protein Pmani_015807 [Petrolisthes manimaculis]
MLAAQEHVINTVKQGHNTTTSNYTLSHTLTPSTVGHPEDSRSSTAPVYHCRHRIASCANTARAVFGCKHPAR